MTINPIQFGDVPVPEGHTRLYRGDWAPGGNPDDLDKWKLTHEEREKHTARMARLVQSGLRRNADFAARAKVEGRWVTPNPELAKGYPYPEVSTFPNSAVNIVNFVDVPNHVWESIQGLKDQPEDVRRLSRMAEDEAILPEEYKSRLTLSRQFSPQEGLDRVDNQNTYL